MTRPCGAPIEPLSKRQKTVAAVALGVLVLLGVVDSRMGQLAAYPPLAGADTALLAEHPTWHTAPGLTLAQQRPRPRRAESDEPLGAPPPVPADAGPYEFMMSQPDAQTPVAYDPCRPLAYVVNDRHAPPGAAVLVAEAVATVSGATGLRFVDEGATDEVPVEDRPAFQMDRYGDRWAPILIAWSDPAETPQLAGGVAGLGGSAHVSTMDRGPLVYVSGVVALDGPQLAEMLTHPEGSARAGAVILHELGHVLGLAHVDDPTHLMHGQGSSVDLQPGDRAGLAQLGAGPCIRRL